MFGKIAKTIVAAEFIGIAALGGLIYARSQYYKGRADAAHEIGESFRELLKETTEKHESQQEEA